MLSRNIDSAKAPLVRRNPDILSCQEALTEFRAHNKQWKSYLEKEKVTEQEYKVWLFAEKEKRV